MEAMDNPDYVSIVNIGEGHRAVILSWRGDSYIVIKTGPKRAKREHAEADADYWASQRGLEIR